MGWNWIDGDWLYSQSPDEYYIPPKPNYIPHHASKKDLFGDAFLEGMRRYDENTRKERMEKVLLEVTIKNLKEQVSALEKQLVDAKKSKDGPEPHERIAYLEKKLSEYKTSSANNVGLAIFLLMVIIGAGSFIGGRYYESYGREEELERMEYVLGREDQILGNAIESLDLKINRLEKRMNEQDRAAESIAPSNSP